MRPIPKKLREDMEWEPFYHRCALSGRISYTSKIEWHHALIFAGRQVNERWCIIPLAKDLHDRISEPMIRELVEWVMLNRATQEELQAVSKTVGWSQKRARLNKKYGKWREGIYPLRNEYA